MILTDKENELLIKYHSRFLNSIAVASASLSTMSRLINHNFEDDDNEDEARFRSRISQAMQEIIDLNVELVKKTRRKE